MKIRTDFVTNSSSSSYVIGKYEDTHVTVEYVYQLVRSLHIQAAEIQKKITEYLGTDEWENICFERSADGDEIVCRVMGKRYFVDKFEVNINEPPYSKWYSFLKKTDDKSTVHQYTVCDGECNISCDDIDFVCEIYDYIKKEAIDKYRIDIVKIWCDNPDESGKIVLVVEYWAKHWCFTANKNSAPVKELLTLIGDEGTYIDFWNIFDMSCIEHETYEDYIKFAEKLSFWIIDYSVPQETRHFYDEESTDSFSETLRWYNDAVKNAFCSLKKGKDCATCEGCDGWMYLYGNYSDDIPPGCEKCLDDHEFPSCHEVWTSKDDERQQLLDEIHRCREMIKENNIPDELACLHFLGRVCVFSRSILLDFWVAEKLEQMAEYGCSHMG